MLPQTTSTIPAIPSAQLPAVALSPRNAPAQPLATAVPAKLSNNISPADQPTQEAASEAAELLKMATALKAEVDKTTKDTLSVAVVRKADQIEQLAHKVRAGTGKD